MMRVRRKEWRLGNQSILFADPGAGEIVWLNGMLFIIQPNQKSRQPTSRAKDDHSERQRRMNGDAGLSDTKRACRAWWLFSLLVDPSFV
jgi:hypothetical protein